MGTIKKYLLETAKYALRSYPIISSYVKELDRLYEMDAEELRRRNEKRFLRIFRKAYDKSPFYHKLYTEAGIRKEDINSLEDIKKLPVITKEMVKKHAREMLTVPRWQVMAANTSGTTGTPLTVYQSWPAVWWSQAYTYAARKRNGFTYGQPLVSLRGHLDKRISHLKVGISNTLYLSSYNITQDTIRRYYDLILKHKPIAIEAYPSSLYSLALFLKDAGLKLHIPVAFTSSETLLDYQRALIETQLDTEIFDNYGMTENCIYLQEARNHQGYYEMPGYSINEYLEDGEICTSLINEAFPLIRYRSNDMMEMAELTEDNPQIIVKKVEGRKEDYLSCKDGSKIMRLDFFFKGVRHVKMSQLVQDEQGKLTVNIVPEVDFNEEDKALVEHNLIQRLGEENIEYCIQLISEKDIKYTKRGKFKYLINLKNIKRGGVIHKIIGRVDDYVICKDGSMVTRIDFIESGKHITACQWVQSEKGKVTILLVPDEGFTKGDEQFVKDATWERVGHDNLDIDLKVVSLNDLIYTSRGKFKLIVNQIAIH